MREAWTIIDNGASANRTCDYGGAPEEDSAILRIYHSSFYAIDSYDGSGKAFYLEDSDGFSAVDEATKERKVRTMSARLRKNKITGSTGETWVVRDVDGDVMTVDYDSGAKEWETRRKVRGIHFIWHGSQADPELSAMTQGEEAKYEGIMAFVAENHRRPLKFYGEERRGRGLEGEAVDGDGER